MQTPLVRSDVEKQRRASAEPLAQAGVAAAAIMTHGDGRSEAVAQRRLEALANQSTQTKSTAAVQRLLNNGVPAQGKGKDEDKPAQKKGLKDEDKKPAQKKGLKDEDKPAQKKGLKDEDKKPAQKKGLKDEDKKPAQRRADAGAAPVQFEAEAAARPNNTGLPDSLKAGVESLSGMSMDGVKVHYNSPEPAHLQAHAFTQGNNIHVAPGQERHLAHEAWHVVQQRQGRVQATAQLKGIGLNDDPGLEREADVMGAQAAAAAPVQLQTYSKTVTKPGGFDKNNWPQNLKAGGQAAATRS